MEKERLKTEKSTKNKNNRKYGSKRRLYETERIVLYALNIVLLAFVISLAVKNYNLRSKLDKVSETGKVENAVTEEVSQEKTEKPSSTENTTEVTEQTTQAMLPLSVQGDVLCTDIETSQKDGTENYNGEDLADNGYPYAIKVNRQENIVTIYKLDEAGYYTVPVRVMRCSVSPIGETPVGVFNVALKWEWLPLFDNCYGQYVSQIEGDTLFHSVPYLDIAKDTLETWEFNKLGTGASLGCVRLCVADTKWIYDNCDSGTYVNIFDSDYYGPLGRPVPVTKLEDTENQGWDPTDMVEENPTTGKAVIYGVESHTIKQGENFDAMAGVMAFDSQRQDVTDQIKVDGKVDNQKAGKYRLKYSFTDQGNEISEDIVITVQDDEPPVITKVPVEVKVVNYGIENAAKRDELAQLVGSYVKAQDGDSEILDVVASEAEVQDNAICVAVDTVKAEPGTYSVDCFAVDAGGNKSQNYKIKVTIVN